MHRCWRAGLSTAVAVGLLAGIKYYALGYALIAVVGISMTALLLGGWRRSVITLATMLSAIFVLAGFWYARNWIETGSPLFPKGFPVLGLPDQWSLMRPGNELSSLIRGVTLRRAEMLAWDFLFQGGLSTFLAVTAVPVVVIWGVFGGLARNRNLSRYLAAAIFGTVLVYISMPNVIESVAGTENMLSSQYHPVRFGAALWTMATVGLVAWIANVRHVWVRFILMIGFVATMAVDVALQFLYHFSFFAVLRDLGISIYPPGMIPLEPATLVLLALDIVLSVAIVSSIDWRPRWRQYCAVALVIGAVMLGTRLQSESWHRQFVPHFDALVFRGSLASIDAELSPTDRLFVCEYRYYPLLNSDRSGSVIRPLYFLDATAFQSQFERSRATHVLVFERDWHSTRTYDSVLRYTQQEPDVFSTLKSWGSIYLLKSTKHSQPKGCTEEPAVRPIRD